MIWIIILLVAAWAVWQLALGIWVLLCLIPTLLVLGPMAVRDLSRWWRGRERRKAALLRKEEFKERVDETVKWFNENYPEDRDVDENGIPYL